MKHIAILGLGNFGSALARLWLLAGHQVTGWTIEQEVYDSIKQIGRNAKYLDQIDLKGLKVTMSIESALESNEIIVLTLPSHVVLQVTDVVIPMLQREHILIDMVKGIAEDQLVSDAIGKQIQRARKQNQLAVITGPTIAPEVAHGVLTNALVASEDLDLAIKLAADLSTDTFILTPASDPKGAELWGAFKNVIALGCGIADGLPEGSGDNLKAAIFTVGFAEAKMLLDALGAEPETAYSAAGLGDLFVTATSGYGRNRTLGQKLGSGLTLEQAMAETVMVAEGVRATKMFATLIHKRKLDTPTPFVSAINALLDNQITATECVKQILARKS